MTIVKSMAYADVCVWCEKTQRVNNNGRFRKHRSPAHVRNCQGSGRLAPCPTMFPREHVKM